jgi:hypothetical protein
MITWRIGTPLATISSKVEQEPDDMDIAELRGWYRNRFLSGSARESEITERLEACLRWMMQYDDTVEMLAGNSLAASPELADPQAEGDRQFVEEIIRNLEEYMSDAAG